MSDDSPGDTPQGADTSWSALVEAEQQLELEETVETGQLSAGSDQQPLVPGDQLAAVTGQLTLSSTEDDQAHLSSLALLASHIEAPV